MEMDLGRMAEHFIGPEQSGMTSVGRLYDCGWSAAAPGMDGFLTVSSFLVCRVHLAPLVPPAKMALMESLAPLGLLVPVDVQAKQALL